MTNCPTCHQAEHKLSCPLREGGQLRLSANLDRPEALRLADALESAANRGNLLLSRAGILAAAAELRRLHAEVERMSADALRLDWVLPNCHAEYLAKWRAAIDQAMKEAP